MPPFIFSKQRSRRYGVPTLLEMQLTIMELFAIVLQLITWFFSSPSGSEWGVYGLTQIFTPLSTYDSVDFYAHSVENLTFSWFPSHFP